MAERKRIPIPYNTAGRLAFDAFRSVAEKMAAVGNEATSDFMHLNFPDSKTVAKEYSDGKYRRIIQLQNGTHIAIVYDYAEQTTMDVFLPHWEPKQRTWKSHEKTNDNFGNRRGNDTVCVPIS